MQYHTKDAVALMVEGRVRVPVAVQDDVTLEVEVGVKI